MITIRKANINDGKFLFDLRNEESVRNNSFNQDLINWDNHINWFTKKINDFNIKLFIIETDGISCGQIRLDSENSEFEISISILPEYRGKGYAKQAIWLAIANCEKPIIAKIKLQNIASIKTFQSVGFIEKSRNKEYITFVY